MDEDIRIGDTGRIRRPRGTDHKNGQSAASKDHEKESADEEREKKDPRERRSHRFLPPGKGENLDVDT